MHASGIGKALLAEIDECPLERLLKTRTLDAFTAQTITDPDALRSHLDDLRRRGYAIDDEDKNQRIRCIAAPVFDVNGEAVAGIPVPGPTSRIGPDDMTRMSRPVMEAAGDLTRAIGEVATRPRS